MPPIIECIPNFSEGRRIEVVDAIINSIEQVDGVRVLHRSSDTDHNRSVVTFVGDKTTVREAAFQAIRTASQLIDMSQHTGVHPRIGAADVVPFVPLQDATMEDCIQIARKLGQSVGNELGLPTYLYEQAATHPERANLAHIRRGQYEGLQEKMLSPKWRPDYGSTRVGKAGAVVIGARKALIAYNVYLNSDDVQIAQKIARTIRASNGGLIGVKALGLLVKGLAQVSMNLTDYHQTAIYHVMEAIRTEAQKQGVTIAHSELIGLLPQDALIETAAWYLQLQDFDASRILENRLSSQSNI
jgi:glutamate formiminotransferase / formiminotetrahydrofolate cyclodeaminase